MNSRRVKRFLIVSLLYFGYLLDTSRAEKRKEEVWLYENEEGEPCGRDKKGGNCIEGTAKIFKAKDGRNEKKY